MQTRSRSIAEALANTVIGIAANQTITEFVFGINGPTAWKITAACFVASITRSYLIRRGFNWLK